jgi:broad specificity phosphatase PhoE
MRMSGWTDTPLSDEGTEEAALVARALGYHRFAALYTSPLQRARDTARAIGAATRRSLIVDNGLKEINCGELDGKAVDDVRVHHAATWAQNAAETDEEFRWPGGESYREFRARCLKAARALSARHPGETVVVVTHAGYISQVLGWIAGVSCARWSSFRPGNASISVIEWGRHRRAILSFDDRVHLAELAVPLATSHPRVG